MSGRIRLCGTCNRWHKAPIGRQRVIKNPKSKLPKWKRNGGVKPIRPSVWAELNAEKRKR